MRYNHTNVFFKNHLQIIFIIILFILINIFSIGFFKETLWDSSVYIGMGKYIYSSGKSGLWEPIRPLTLPLILGLFWKIGLNPLIYGRILILVLSIGVIIIAYAVSTRLFDKQAAIAASIILSLSSLILNVSHEILVEIPAVFLLLLGFYSYILKKNFFAGIFFGLAFLTKFPTMIFLFVILGTEIVLFLKPNINGYSERIRAIKHLVLAFVLTVFPYFLFNFIYYKDAFSPIKSAKYVIDNVVGCTILNLKPAYYYIPLILKDNPLHFFFIFGLMFTLSKMKHNSKLYVAQTIVYIAAFLVYFTSLACKTDRYPILALPFISIITGYGISSLFSKWNKSKKYSAFLLGIFVITISSVISASNLINNAPHSKNAETYSYRTFNANGEILTTTPEITLYTDAELNLIYYPLYGSAKVDYYVKYIKKNKQGIAYVVMNTEDIPCHPSDLECADKTQEFIKFLKGNFRIIHYKKINYNEQFIFSQ